MSRFYSFSIIVGACIGMFLTYIDLHRPKIVNPPNLDFIKRNGQINNSGETYEVFWPVLDKLENLEHCN